MRLARSVLLLLTSALEFLPQQSMLAQAAAPRCSSGSRVLRGAIGASLGAWVGLVMVKIKYSDWSDASRAPSGVQTRNRAIVLGAVLGASLGSAPLETSCGPALGRPDARGDARSVISADEIQRSGINGTAYDVVFTLRRNWLNTRGVELSETPGVILDDKGGGQVLPADPTLMVYLDNVRLGDMAQLHTIPAASMLAVRYYDAAQATQRWGAGHNHGAIQVLSVTGETR